MRAFRFLIFLLVIFSAGTCYFSYKVYQQNKKVVEELTRIDEIVCVQEGIPFKMLEINIPKGDEK